jgi:hypothetical protein
MDTILLNNLRTAKPFLKPEFALYEMTRIEPELWHDAGLGFA